MARPPSKPALRDTSLATYRAKRNFNRTAEPSPTPVRRKAAAIFVVQKHDASRLHYDFRLEHAGVLWSWAIPKGPSLDPDDKRLAVHVEDHPLDYATFEGTIPKGQYGGGLVALWDRGTWRTLGDPAADLARGELKFELEGTRLRGKFVLIRLKPRPKDQAENWLLIKEHDEHEEVGGDVAAMETIPLPKPPGRRTPAVRATRSEAPTIPGAVRGSLPATQAPQLASLVQEPPTEAGWISEIKFDGYRLLVFKDGDAVRLMTRNGLDWTSRLPSVATMIAKLAPRRMLLDCELVALRPDGVSSFADLQAALSRQRDAGLVLFAFDLLHLEGLDLRPCRLDARKAAMGAMDIWSDRLRFSDHVDGEAGPVRRQACAMGLEGIIAKRASAPYRAGRGNDWVKLKCGGREEFIVLGWTPPAGTRAGLGALQLGYFDHAGQLHYAGSVGAGFTDGELRSLRARLDRLSTDAPADLQWSGEPLDRRIDWVERKMVAEVQFIGWSPDGRLRHAVYLGLREDKAVSEVIRAVPGASEPPAPRPKIPAAAPARLTHPDKQLWPGVTKQQLAEYWAAVAEIALPGIAGRPLALVRCPDGVGGQHFFQKHLVRGMPAVFREGVQDGAPYLVFDDAAGLQAAAQMAAIELHTWGSSAADPAHADRLVFDLDPGEGVEWPTIVSTALELRDRLAREGLASFCRTSGGNGLHVVAPIEPGADWDSVRAWCRAFAEAMADEFPDRFVAAVPKARRTGRILVDWLRNGLGSTAIASFSPRARPGAMVATPLTWREVTPRLQPGSFTIATIPKRLARQKRDPWEGFSDKAKPLPPAKLPAKSRKPR